MTEAAAIADTRVHPGTIAIRYVKDLPQTLIGLPAVFALMSDTGWSYIVPIALTAALVLGLTQWLAWSRFRYGLGASELLIESGLLSRNRRSIPFERIQDLDIEQGPLHRLFGLAKVKVETGRGGQGRGRARQRHAGRGGPAPPRHSCRAGPGGSSRRGCGGTERPRCFHHEPSEGVRLGLVQLLADLGRRPVRPASDFEPLIPFDVRDPGRWLGLVESGQERFTAGAIAAVLLVALGLGVITGILRTLSRDWNFRLSAEGKRLRRTRGLFTRTEAVIPKRRVQLALLRTGPLRQAVGVGELFVQTLGSSKGQGGCRASPRSPARPKSTGSWRSCPVCACPAMRRSPACRPVPWCEVRSSR
jgi:putative membrane protein